MIPNPFTVACQAISMGALALVAGAVGICLILAIPVRLWSLYRAERRLAAERGRPGAPGLDVERMDKKERDQ